MIVGAFDIEHSKDIFKPWEEGFYISCIGLIDNTNHKQILWFDHKEHQDNKVVNLQYFQAWLNSLDVVCAHNLKHDMNIMRYLGIDFENVKLYCTMVTEYLLSGQNVSAMRFDLNEVCKNHGLNPKLDVVRTQWWDCGIDTYEVPTNILADYVLDDTQKVLDLYEKQNYFVKQQNKAQLVKLHNEFTMSLSDMELAGFNWDLERSKSIYEEYMGKVCEIERDLHEIAGDDRINFGSPKQLGAFLFGGTTKVVYYQWVTKEVKKDNATRYYEKKFEEDITLRRLFNPPRKGKKTKTGEYRTDKNTINDLVARTLRQKRVKDLLLRRSEAQKVAETLIGKRTESGLNSKVQPDGRIHTKFNQAVTATGRLSSSDPNGQNFPRGSTSPIKQCIIPPYSDWWICQYDLSQVEWKAAGELSNDEIMINEINSGVDQHSATCTDLMLLDLTKENRTNAKIFNFRMIFGGTAYGFNNDSKMPSFGFNRWAEIVDAYNQKYYGLAEYNRRNIENVLRGNTVQTFTGRSFTFTKSSWRDGIWQYNENQIKNYPIQGLAGGDLLPLVCSIIRRGMKKEKLEAYLFITVHDQIGFMSPLDEIETIYKLCSHVGDNIPKYVEMFWGYKCKVKKWGGEFEVGKNFGQMEEYSEWIKKPF